MRRVPVGSTYDVRRGRWPRWAAAGLVVVFGYSAFITWTGAEVDGPPVMIAGRCLALVDAGWVPANCDQPSAVTPAQAAKIDADRLSPAQIRDVWVAAGGDPAAAEVAVAVAMAESGGRPGAISPPNSDGHSSIDRGLWQINDYWHGADSTTDVARNAAAAVRISGNGTNWKPWSTVVNGRYRQHLGLV